MNSWKTKDQIQLDSRHQVPISLIHLPRTEKHTNAETINHHDGPCSIRFSLDLFRLYGCM
jgi:hypothetical protein